jgi:hypothetical protein
VKSINLHERVFWRWLARFARLLEVPRPWFTFALGLLVMPLSGLAAAEGMSNPPFLGITMQSNQVGTMFEGVLIEGVTASTAAERAGFLKDDVIEAIDGQRFPDVQASPTQNPTTPTPVDVLIDRIAAHTVGDEVTFRVRHNQHIRDVTAVLSSRTDVMQQHVVGTQLDVPVVDLDSGEALELGAQTGRTMIVGWTVREGAGRCSDCMRVLDKIDRRVRRLGAADGPRVMGLTNDSTDNVRHDRDQLGTTLPVLRADGHDIEQTLIVADTRRLAITVSDCHGIVKFVAVILPGADDEDAVIDEIVAAVEQASAHPVKSRR